jgi:DNA-binding NarL/FixJ family response regulator
MTRQQLDQILSEEENVQSTLDVLDNREVEVFSLLSQGYSSNNICRELQISLDELARFKAAIQKKLNLKNEIQLFQFAVKQRTSEEASI